MPQKIIPPDWSDYLFYWLFTAIAGALGALVRQIHEPSKKMTRILADTICGAIFSMFGAVLVSQILYYTMNK